MYSKETVVRTIKGEKKEVNMIFGTGRLTNDPPEVREVKTYKVMKGSKAHNFSIAFDNGKDKPTSFLPLELWDKNAENMARLGFKGQLVELRGRIDVQQYKDKEGKDREFEVLVVERFDFKQYKNSNGNKNSQNPTDENDTPTGGTEPTGYSDPNSPYGFTPINLGDGGSDNPEEFDDIPF